MLVDVGINSEHTGINNIMFNYSFHRTLATEYEELKTKISRYGPSSHSGKHHESDRSHSGFLRGAPVKGLKYNKGH